MRIAPVLLPHLNDRPISLKRYPEGVTGPYFYEKQCPPYRPDWIKTAPTKSKRLRIDYCGLWIQKILKHLSIECFPKTSGSKGLQLYVPLNTLTNYGQTKAFAHALAERMQREHPRQVVSKMLKKLRVRKVLMDWSQNDAHKTTVCVYSLRAKNSPTVSTPLTWDEVAAALRRTPPVFESHDVLVRVEKCGDLFEPVLKLKQKLPTIESLNEADP
jgi:bifunctional non-homologous end joining protein LigD